MPPFASLVHASNSVVYPERLAQLFLTFLGWISVRMVLQACRTRHLFRNGVATDF